MSRLAAHADQPLCSLPLLTLVYLLLECQQSAPDREAVYSSVEPALAALRKVHDRQAMAATMDLALLADARGEAAFAERFLQQGIDALAAVGAASRLACHSLLAQALLGAKSLPAERVVALSRELETRDAAQSEDVERCVDALAQCALLHVAESAAVRTAGGRDA